jgi:hypothetical protein
MKTFTVYRRLDISATHSADQANPPDQPQFEGVVFSDGTVAIKWLTAVRSCAVFQSLTDLQKIHGHPEYGSEWVWHDQAAADLAERPTRDDLSALIADHFMLGKKYADQYADIFIAAGVKVRP